MGGGVSAGGGGVSAGVEVVAGVGAISSRLLQADSSAATAHSETRSFVLISAPESYGKALAPYAAAFAQAARVMMSFAVPMSYFARAQVEHSGFRRRRTFLSGGDARAEWAPRNAARPALRLIGAASGLGAGNIPTVGLVERQRSSATRHSSCQSTDWLLASRRQTHLRTADA
jgi:hypothetical protein